MFSTADTFKFPFAVYDNGASPRALANADSTPTGTLVVNGTDVGTTVTVTNPATGRYIASVALSGLSVGDLFYLRVSVTKTPTSGSATTELVHSQVSRINASIATPTNFTSMSIDGSGRVASDIKRAFSDSGKTDAFDLLLGYMANQGSEDVADGFAKVFYYYNVNTNTLPQVAAVVGAVGSITDITNISSAISSAQSAIINAINALNQSASRRVVLQTVAQMERPESGSSNFQIELRTYDGDGAAVNADSTPTITATGILSGNLSGNLGAVSNPATGVYRATYNVESTDTPEQIMFEASATISASTFTMTAFSLVADFVAATFTTDDRALIQSTKDNVDAIEEIVVDQLATMLVSGPGTYRFTESSGVLFLAPVQAKTDNLPSIPIAYSEVSGEARLWVLNGSGNEIPTAGQIDAELSDTHGDGSWESGESATAEDIWNHDDRTLTSFPPSIELLFPQPGIGAFIPGADSEGWPRTLTINAIAGTTIVVLARVVYTDGTYLTQADVSAATSQIVDPDASSQESPVTLTVSQVIYDTLQMDGQWSEDAVGYNLRVVIAGTRIPSTNKLYTANVSLTTATGPIKLAWSIQT